MCRAGTLSPPDGEGCAAQESREPCNEQLEKEVFYHGTSGLSGLPGLCNLSVSTALGEADSIKIKVVEVGWRVTGASLIIGIGSSPFVFLSL